MGQDGGAVGGQAALAAVLAATAVDAEGEQSRARVGLVARGSQATPTGHSSCLRSGPRAGCAHTPSCYWASLERSYRSAQA